MKSESPAPAVENGNGAQTSSGAGVSPETKSAGETIETAAATESKSAGESVTQAAKKTRFAKPLLITAGVLVVLFAVYKKFIQKPKAA